MNQKRRITRVVLLVGGLVVYLLGVSLWGCSGISNDDDRAIVAQVGDRPIELRQITDYITALHVDYPTPEKELEARKKKLDDLIQNEYLVIGGYSQALDADIGIIELVDREKDKFLLDELFRHEVIDKATVTENEVKQVYANYFDRVRLKHILVKTKAEADSLEALLKGGADFGDLAEANSIDKSTAIRGGDFGREFKWGDLIPPLQEAAFTLKEGEISAPLQSDFGWHILQIQSHTKIEQKPLEEVYSGIESNLKRMAMEKLRLKQLDSLRSHSNITLVPQGVAALRKQLRLVSDTASGELRAMRKIPVDSLPGTVTDQQVATYGRDGVITVGQLLNRINSRPYEGRADMADDNQVKEAVFQLGLFDLLRDQALSLHMDEQPLYQERLVEFREKLMADKMRQSIISRNLRLPEEDVRAYYEAHPDSFIEPTAYHVIEVMVHDSTKAKRILRAAEEGTPLTELAQKYTERPGFQSSGGDLGWVRPNRYPDLYRAATQLKKDEVGGPFAGVDQYSVIQVIDVQPPRMREYDEVQPSLFQTLQQRRSDSIMGAYIDSMKTIYPVVIHDDVLRRNLRVVASEAQPVQNG